MPSEEDNGGFKKIYIKKYLREEIRQYMHL